MKTIAIPQKGTLIVSNDLCKQIDYLHKNTPENLEWSGLLFYKLTKGDVFKNKAFTVQADHIQLADIGTSVHTTYKLQETDVFELFKERPDLSPYKKSKHVPGQIHTHHSMSTFFSSTDQKDLEKNVGSHKFYLSLIVNYEGTYMAKMAYVGKKYAMSIPLPGGGHINLGSSEEVMVEREMKIVVEREQFEDKYFVKRFKEVLKLFKKEPEFNSPLVAAKSNSLFA